MGSCSGTSCSARPLLELDRAVSNHWGRLSLGECFLVAVVSFLVLLVWPGAVVRRKDSHSGYHGNEEANEVHTTVAEDQLPPVHANFFAQEKKISCLRQEEQLLWLPVSGRVHRKSSWPEVLGWPDVEWEMQTQCVGSVRLQG